MNMNEIYNEQEKCYNKGFDTGFALGHNSCISAVKELLGILSGELDESKKQL